MVWSILNGWGVVERNPAKGGIYTLLVKDVSSYTEVLYTKEGYRFESDKQPELYLREQIVRDKPRELDWTKITKGTPVYVGTHYKQMAKFVMYKPRRATPIATQAQDPSSGLDWWREAVILEEDIKEEWYAD